MRKSRTWVVCGLALAIASVMLAPNAEARKEYNDQFWDLYPTMKEHKETKCGVCHPVSDKKVRNDYGKALGESLGAKSVKDADKIKEGLKKAAKEKSATEGKTFGDLIEDGKLPGKAQ